MDIPHHLLYCPAGTPYFDLPDSGDGEERFGVGDVPPGWRTTSDTEWTYREPPRPELPDQGWKIHVSAVAEGAARVLRHTAEYCFEHGVMFKHLRGPAQLFRRNWKYAERSGSGKFITVYPSDDAEFTRVLTELGEKLDGEPGPYILSDVRWRDGPLYVRFGAFRKLEFTLPDGTVAYGVVAPDGTMERDVRRPGFHPPAWATPPAVLTEALEARSAGVLRDFPYAVQRPLHYSNGGGIYRATDTRDGAQVLLREARPHAGTDLNGQDALHRLRAESAALTELQGIPIVPRVIEHRRGHEHHYLVREYVEGVPWAQWVLEHHPMLVGTRTAAERSDYLDAVLGLFDTLAAGIRQLHGRGAVFADLHPRNVLVTPDSRPIIIDLETVRSTDSPLPQLMAAPGFVAPTSLRGAAIDEHALALVLLWSLVPITGPPSKGPELVDAYLDIAARWFDDLDGVRERIEERLRVEQPDGTTTPYRYRPEATRRAVAPRSPEDRATALTASILGSADVTRTDRLYPGDALQFSPGEGGLGLAFGAAGVLWALASCEVEVPPEHVTWLADRVDDLPADASGLASGRAGVALALARLGREDQALDLLRTSLRDAAGGPDHTLWRGSSGTALAGLYLADTLDADDPRDQALAIAERLTTALGRRLSGDPSGLPPGLAHGPLGEALFLLHSHALTGEPAQLEVAAHVLRREIAEISAVTSGIGAPPAAFGFARGVAGIALVADVFLRLAQDDQVSAFLESARVILDRPLHPDAGLANGRAGLALGLTIAGAPAPVVRGHLDLIASHLVRDAGGWGVLGEQGLRVSHDLATGTAGVLLVEHAVSTGRPVLPFLTGEWYAAVAERAVR